MVQAITPPNTPNNTQNFYPADDHWEIVNYPFVASTAIAGGTAVGIQISGNTTTGNLTAMGAENASGADFVGILQDPIRTTDTDYATAGKLRAVWVPNSEQATAFFKVISGTFTTADVFKTVEFASSGLGLAVDTAGKGARIVGYVSSTKGTCQFTLPTTETA